jgi:AraC-like DNA-binding protein
MTARFRRSPHLARGGASGTVPGMRVYEGRYLATPGHLRSSVARIRALDWTPLAREEQVSFLPTVSSSLVVVTTSEGAALRMLVAGPTTAAKYKTYVPAPSFVQLRLEPWAARAAFGVPLHELVDRVVEIDEIWGRSGRELLHALAPLEGKAGPIVAKLEGALLRRLDRAKPMADAGIVRHATRALGQDTGKATGILALAERLGVGERALRQAFREHIGISPKRYARIARIRRVASRAGAAPWADLALDHGFYDQAHLNAEFRALLGVTPRDFLAGRLPFTAPR